MEIIHLVSKSQALTLWVANILQNVEVRGDIRSRFAVACLDVALEHREALVLLIAQAMYGSAFALVRLVFEAYVRGVWLHRCASDAEIEAFKNDKLHKTFDTLIQEIEGLEGFELGILSRLKKQGWKALNSYTHSGYMQVVRRMKAETLEPNYTPDEIVEVLDCTNALGLLCVLQTAFLSTDEQLPMTILNKTESFIQH